MSQPSLQTVRPLDLTAAQAEVLRAQRADPTNAAYNVGQYVELSGPVDPDALQHAVRHTLGEAPGLHLRVREHAGRPLQTPARFEAEHWRLPRLNTSDAADPEAAAVELVRAQLACPPRMGLLLTEDDPGDAADPGAADAGPVPGPALTGAVLVTVGPERHLLFQYFHHLAIDGYGVSLLNRRIAEVYTARVRGTETPPSPFAPVGTLVDAERDYASSGRYAADRAHWAARYADGPTPAPVSGRDATRPADVALRRTVLLDRPTAALIRATARAARVTWAEAVTAAVAAHRALTTGVDEAVLRLYAMARVAPGTLRVPGMAVNILPVRVRVGADARFDDLLRRAGSELADVRRHQLFRGETVARELWPGSGGERLRGPLLNFRPFDDELDFAGVPGHVVTLASGPVDDLSVSVSAYADGRLRLDFDANPARYGSDGLAAYSRQCVALLTRLSAEPGRPLAALGAWDVPGGPGDGHGAGSVRPRPAVPAPRVEAPGPAAGKPRGGRGGSGRGRGGLPLLPAAHRLRESGGPAELLQETVLLRVPAGLRTAPLRRALALLARRHDALRLRLHRAHGVWSQEILPAATAPAAADPATLRRIDITGPSLATDGRVPEQVLTREARRAARALDSASGAVLRAVWFDAGQETDGRLLLTLHRLCADGDAWPPLVAELAAHCAAFMDGREPPRAAGGPGPREWAAVLHEQAHEPSRITELPYWRGVLADASTDARAAAAGRAGAVDGPELVTGATGLPPVADPVGSGHHAHDWVDLAVPAALALLAADEPRLRGTGADPLVELACSPDPLAEPAPGAPTARYPVRLHVENGENGGRDGSGAHDGSDGHDWSDHDGSGGHDGSGDGAPDTGRLAVSGVPVGEGDDQAAVGARHDVSLPARVAAQLAAVPDGGRGYEQLRHLNPQTAPLLAGPPLDALRYVRRRPPVHASGWAAAPAEEEAVVREALAGLGTEPVVSGPLELTVTVGTSGDGRTDLSLRWRWHGGPERGFTADEARRLARRGTALIARLAPVAALAGPDEGSRAPTARTVPAPGTAAPRTLRPVPPRRASPSPSPSPAPDPVREAAPDHLPQPTQKKTEGDIP
ncbi:condensation domain-containing protein [Streptomyces sp. AM 4-1-1]|uniref:condensation domain-containing protein n=1 Tax=Streptomyces sp. AM 4-1-1 TaxID=3028710 RepID=UPI0023B99E6E|nr:condensation domain-containing protein [Streptomyces sp. AM 4-1-1]WEH35885.1 condensation domain-containing protein [Streptomyces sp. AM 4-1-1]